MTASNKQISDAIESGVQAAPAQNVPEWQGAADAVLAVLIEEGDCFSSGEIAAHLRTFRPDIRFSVTSSIGDHLRQRFYGCSMPLYPQDDGTMSTVEMVPRVTAGFTRTPVDTEVFVYAKDYQSGMDHEFEVEIPKPGVQVPVDPTDVYGLPAKPVQAPTPVQPKSHFVNLLPKARKDITATVHSDSRCYVPRSAFEALLHETQTALKGGDAVFVTVDEDEEEATINLDQVPGSQKYLLVATRGRVLFPHPVTPFTPGDSYRVNVDGPGRRLVVDLSATL